MRFLLLLTTLSLVAIDTSIATTEIWKMGNRYFQFSRNASTGLLVSKSCEQKKCHAIKILKTLSFKKLSPNKFTDGKNPGAVLCHELKNTQVIFLRDLNGNDNSFCLFSDKSIISSGSLELEARKNDEN